MFDLAEVAIKIMNTENLWRKELVKGPLLYGNILSTTPANSASKKSEGQFVEEVSKLLKIFKRKEEMYFRIADVFGK